MTVKVRPSRPLDGWTVVDHLHMPVGEDHQQHLELTRDLAESFDRTYSSPTPLFQLPELILSV